MCLPTASLGLHWVVGKVSMARRFRGLRVAEHLANDN
jgi:hypothetical protein